MSSTSIVHTSMKPVDPVPNMATSLIRISPTSPCSAKEFARPFHTESSTPLQKAFNMKRVAMNYFFQKLSLVSVFRKRHAGVIEH